MKKLYMIETGSAIATDLGSAGRDDVLTTSVTTASDVVDMSLSIESLEVTDSIDVLRLTVSLLQLRTGKKRVIRGIVIGSIVTAVDKKCLVYIKINELVFLR